MTDSFRYDVLAVVLVLLLVLGWAWTGARRVEDEAVENDLDIRRRLRRNGGPQR